jgi:CheY-like chemotaxis protein
VKKTILCVDDEPVLCRLLRNVLGETGAEVATFTDPLAALDFLRDHDVCLVICDYRMPTLTGLEVLARMEREVPFALLSGDLDIQAIADGVPGVTAVLAKPFSPKALVTFAQSCLATCELP